MEEMKQLKYFESQQPDEQIVFLIRRHILAMMPVFAISFLLYAIGFALIFVFPALVPGVVAGFNYNVYVLIVSLLFLFNTVFLFSNWVLHYLHVALLTTEHFVEIEQYGLFGRRVSELTLDRIQDVTNDQKGLIHTIFNLGFVKIQTAGEAPNFELQFVPDPYKICQTIMETEENYSSRHGLRGNSVSGNANQVQTTGAPVEPETTHEPEIEYPGGEWNQEQK
jgi:uncharacterized membrane protein YdbT with pleckstrin-like domain